MTTLDNALTIGDLKTRARRRVPKQFFDYSESGSWTEQTFRANESDFADVLFRQRLAVDLRDRNLASTMLGQPVSLPLAVAPAAICGLQIADGEIHAARAAQKFGIPFSLSTMSICSIEQVADAVDRPFWFQVYVMRDKAFMEQLILRAKAAGCSALILTMDLQILGHRHSQRHERAAQDHPGLPVRAHAQAGLGHRHARSKKPHLRQRRRQGAGRV